MNRDRHSGGMTREEAKEFKRMYDRRKQMMPVLGEQVRLHFESLLDDQKMKLLAIRADNIALKKSEQNQKTRGNTVSMFVANQNFIFLFGCKPEDGVKADT